MYEPMKGGIHRIEAGIICAILLRIGSEYRITNHKRNAKANCPAKVNLCQNSCADASLLRKYNT